MRLFTILVLASSLIFTASVTAQSNKPEKPLTEEFDGVTLSLAAHNIVKKAASSYSDSVTVMYSEEKEQLAALIIGDLEKKGIFHTKINIGGLSDFELKQTQTFIRSASGKQKLIFLTSRKDAGFLFGTIGDPVSGFLIPEEQFFSDLLISPSALVRLHGADCEEIGNFRSSLLKEITGVGEIQITTENGTDITVKPRTWIVSDGEIFTAPIEDISNGTIFVDACSSGAGKHACLKSASNLRITMESLRDSNRLTGSRSGCLRLSDRYTILQSMCLPWRISCPESWRINR